MIRIQSESVYSVCVCGGGGLVVFENIKVHSYIYLMKTHAPWPWCFWIDIGISLHVLQSTFSFIVSFDRHNHPMRKAFMFLSLSFIIILFYLKPSAVYPNSAFFPLAKFNNNENTTSLFKIPLNSVAKSNIPFVIFILIDSIATFYSVITSSLWKHVFFTWF